MLTATAAEICLWINSFGFVQYRQLQDYFRIDNQQLTKIVNNLIEQEYIISENIFSNHPTTYRVTKKATNSIKDKLPPLKKINLSTYTHNVLVTELAIYFTHNLSATFVTERNIRQQRGLQGVGQRGHIADGELSYRNQKIALECELSSKGSIRRKNIINHYLKNIEYDEMWYLYNKNSVYRQIAPLVSKMNFIKLINLNDLDIKVPHPL